jgi:hypothetical protein
MHIHWTIPVCRKSLNQQSALAERLRDTINFQALDFSVTVTKIKNGIIDHLHVDATSINSSPHI